MAGPWEGQGHGKAMAAAQRSGGARGGEAAGRSEPCTGGTGQQRCPPARLPSSTQSSSRGPATIPPPGGCGPWPTPTGAGLPGKRLLLPALGHSRGGGPVLRAPWGCASAGAGVRQDPLPSPRSPGPPMATMHDLLSSSHCVRLGRLRFRTEYKARWGGRRRQQTAG